MRRNLSLCVAGGLLITVSLFPAAASARDRGFSAVVHAVENTYHVRRSNRFICWFAGVAIRFARPEGIKHLRLAIFEDQDFSPSSNDAGFERSIEDALADDWQPIIRVRSRRDGERTHIYARQNSDDVNLFIVSIEEDEAVVMEVGMDEKEFAKLIDSPDQAGRGFWANSEKDTRPVASEALRPALQRRNSLAAENR
jgi:hypothetical protein